MSRNADAQPARPAPTREVSATTREAQQRLYNQHAQAIERLMKTDAMIRGLQ